MPWQPNRDGTLSGSARETVAFTVIPVRPDARLRGAGPQPRPQHGHADGRLTLLLRGPAAHPSITVPLVGPVPQYPERANLT